MTDDWETGFQKAMGYHHHINGRKVYVKTEDKMTITALWATVHGLEDKVKRLETELKWVTSERDRYRRQAGKFYDFCLEALAERDALQEALMAPGASNE